MANKEWNSVSVRLDNESFGKLKGIQEYYDGMAITDIIRKLIVEVHDRPSILALIEEDEYKRKMKKFQQIQSNLSEETNTEVETVDELRKALGQTDEDIEEVNPLPVVEKDKEKDNSKESKSSSNNENVKSRPLQPKNSPEWFWNGTYYTDASLEQRRKIDDRVKEVSDMRDDGGTNKYFSNMTKKEKLTFLQVLFGEDAYPNDILDYKLKNR
ncbi:hypothetical protein [Geomicrobium sp. JCM 19055]|uniref:hypothetical protein n=1 Tax=Geomicrobium sp. JCM 19055 TaxID=1460649 RepID=UPI00045ED44F|nr:hypothetical protein [Geomicrobium sp. JCM 19055]GAK00926.1 hypothetical protein JCM19055_4053 [Geomicrobium sp. JCM 19055]